MSRVPPAAVRREFRRGLELLAQGRGGDGLRGETVQWAERLARGEPISEAKAVKMRAWFARHGASPLEVSARRRQEAALRAGTLRGKAPALVAWLLWGGDAARAWVQRLVPRSNPAILERCVERVRPRITSTSSSAREATSRAWAICTASLQRAGYMSPGTRKLTPAGKLAERRRSRHRKDR